MQTTPLVSADHQLDHLARQFAQWRQSRAHAAERIPLSLWEQAMALAATVPPSRVAKRVGVRLIDLKRRLGLPEAAPRAVPLRPLDFVEVPAAAPCPPPTLTTRLELQRADGTRLCLHGPASTLPVAAIVQAFLEGHLCCK
jgi:hypothetical protein